MACGKAGRRQVHGRPAGSAGHPACRGRVRSEMRLLRTRARHDRPGDAPVADDSPMPADAAALPATGDLELPAPARLALTAGWNLAESLGLPLAAYAVGERLGGQGAGMAAATATVWLTAVVRKALTRSVPGLLMISALVLTLQTALVLATGSGLLFL